MHHTVLLLGTLLTAFLGGGYVAWAEDFPCQGWGTTTFVYEADVVEACLNTDIDLNAGINRTGTTPLIGAVQLGDNDAVWLLLAAGANPNKQDRQGWTPLMFAAQAGHQEIVRQLAKAGADPHLRNDAGQTALLLALDQEQTAMVGPLVAAGATIDAATLVGLVEQGQQRVLAALAARGVNLDIRLAGGETLLMVAAERGHQTIVEQLLANGLDPTRPAENGARLCSGRQKPATGISSQTSCDSRRTTGSGRSTGRRSRGGAGRRAALSPRRRSQHHHYQ